jgi:Na+/melibiose symporter-like transporter
MSRALARVPGLPALSAQVLAAYGLMGLPLAFVALPIYVHLPQLYADFGLSLASIGAVLLAARLWDALIDPLIGYLGDRWGQRRRAIFAALPLLAAGFLGLLHPPAGEASAMRLLAMLLLVYLGYSLASVSYHAWGAELSADPVQRTRITAAREGLALLGVVLAAALPGVLGDTLALGLARLSWLFVAVLAIAALCLLRVPAGAAARHTPDFAAIYRAFRNRRFLRLLAVFALSGIAAASPASLVLFFLADVLQAGDQAGAYLALYFIAGALGLPLWVTLARRVGKLAAWGVAMGLSVLVFVWAGMLGPGDLVAFAAICALSGLALGADLALPPSILADVIEHDAEAGAGTYFGWWNFVAKLNLALAAGLSLPVLAALGYEPGVASETGQRALAWIYAGVPAVLKLCALALLWRTHRAISPA